MKVMNKIPIEVLNPKTGKYQLVKNIKYRKMSAVDLQKVAKRLNLT